MSRTVRRAMVGLTLTLVAAGAVGAGAYVTWLRTPPAMPDTVQEAMAVFASPRYTRLPEERRTAYIEHVRRLVERLPEGERRSMWRRLHDEPTTRDAADRAMQDMMVAQARAFATADETARVAMLDAFLARRELRATTGEDGPSPQRRDEARRRMQHYVQYGDPQNQAYMQEFWKALRERRHELGLTR